MALVEQGDHIVALLETSDSGADGFDGAGAVAAGNNGEAGREGVLALRRVLDKGEGEGRWSGLWL
jgi:hypothetical protein